MPLIKLIVMLLWLTLGLSATVSGQVSPQARRTLDQMKHAYQTVHTFYQETHYLVSEGARAPISSAKLIVQRPNHFLMDVFRTTNDPSNPERVLYQSDGKKLWGYQQSKGYYTEDPAPKSMQDAQLMSYGLEMAMITGMDPIAGFLSNCKSARITSSQSIDFVDVDGVELEMVSDAGTALVTFFVGQKDHFIRRFDYALTPSAPAEGVSSILGAVRTAVHLEYENQIPQQMPSLRNVFVWLAPPGAFKYERYPNFMDLHGGGSAASKAAPAASGKSKIKPMKILTWEELVAQSKKKR